MEKSFIGTDIKKQPSLSILEAPHLAVTYTTHIGEYGAISQKDTISYSLSFLKSRVIHEFGTILQ